MPTVAVAVPLTSPMSRISHVFGRLEIVATAPSTLALSTARVSDPTTSAGQVLGINKARLSHRIAGGPRVVDAHHVKITQHHGVTRLIVTNDATECTGKNIATRGLDCWRLEEKGATRTDAHSSLERRIGGRVDHRHNVFEANCISHQHWLDFFFDDVCRNAVDFLFGTACFAGTSFFSVTVTTIGPDRCQRRPLPCVR